MILSVMPQSRPPAALEARGRQDTEPGHGARTQPEPLSGPPNSGKRALVFVKHRINGARERGEGAGARSGRCLVCPVTARPGREGGRRPQGAHGVGQRRGSGSPRDPGHGGCPLTSVVPRCMKRHLEHPASEVWHRFEML